MDKLLQLTFQGTALGCVYALIALGFVIVFKGSGVFNFAHADFVMVAAYVAVTVAATQYGLGVIAALLCMVVLAVVVERLVLRRLAGQPLFAVVMVTLGLSIMTRAVLAMVWGVETKGSTEGPMGRGVVHLGDVVLPWASIWTVVVSLGLLGVLWWFFQRTRHGLALRASAAHHEAAMAQGIDVRWVHGLSWAIAGGLAVAAGLFLGSFPREVTPTMGDSALGALPAIIIGGFDSLPGAVVGGIVVGLLQVLGAGYLDDVGGGKLHEILPYVVMLLVLVVRPYGLFGSRSVERV